MQRQIGSEDVHGEFGHSPVMAVQCRPCHDHRGRGRDHHLVVDGARQDQRRVGTCLGEFVDLGRRAGSVSSGAERARSRGRKRSHHHDGYLQPAAVALDRVDLPRPPTP